MGAEEIFVACGFSESKVRMLREVTPFSPSTSRLRTVTRETGQGDCSKCCAGRKTCGTHHQGDVLSCHLLIDTFLLCFLLSRVFSHPEDLTDLLCHLQAGGAPLEKSKSNLLFAIAQKFKVRLQFDSRGKC